MEKFYGWMLIIIGLLFASYQIKDLVMAEFQYTNKMGCWWSLAEKSSTIKAKEEYIDKFVASIKSNLDINEHNALYLFTPDNSVKYNLEALLTLQKRLKEIKNMNVSSFEYQSAIQQITAQEQGEAQKMIEVFTGVYTKNNFFFIWSWVGGIICCFWIGMIFLGTIIRMIAT